MTATDTVLTFMAKLSAMRIDEAMEILAADVVYHDVPSRPVVGCEAVAGKIAGLRVQAMDSIVHHMAEDDGIVLNERTDRFHLEDGRWVELRVMGSFEVVDGQITAWRDYFDLGQWARAVAPGG